MGDKEFIVQYHAQRFGKSYHQITSILDLYVSNGFLGKDIVIKIVPCDEVLDMRKEIERLKKKIKSLLGEE